MKKFVLIFVTAVAVASVSVFAAYNLPENTDASKYENTHTCLLYTSNCTVKSAWCRHKSADFSLLNMVLGCEKREVT